MTVAWPLTPTSLIVLLVPPRSIVTLWQTSVVEPSVWLSMLWSWCAARCPTLLPPVTVPQVLCSPGGTWLRLLRLPTWWKLVLVVVVRWPMLVLVRSPVALTRLLVSSIVLDVPCSFSSLMTSLLWLDTIRALEVHSPVTLTRFLVSCVVCIVIRWLNRCLVGSVGPTDVTRQLVIVPADGMVRPMTWACEWTAGSILRVSGVYSSYTARGSGLLTLPSSMPAACLSTWLMLLTTTTCYGVASGTRLEARTSRCMLLTLTAIPPAVNAAMLGRALDSIRWATPAGLLERFSLGSLSVVVNVCVIPEWLELGGL